MYVLKKDHLLSTAEPERFCPLCRVTYAAAHHETHVGSKAHRALLQKEADQARASIHTHSQARKHPLVRIPRVGGIPSPSRR